MFFHSIYEVDNYILPVSEAARAAVHESPLPVLGEDTTPYFKLPIAVPIRRGTA